MKRTEHQQLLEKVEAARNTRKAAYAALNVHYTKADVEAAVRAARRIVDADAAEAGSVEAEATEARSRLP